MEKIGYCINYGGGVNSTAILSLLCQGKLDYSNPIILFADTGAERPQTYEYITYIQPILKEFGFDLITVTSKEGSLYNYCKNKSILPMRSLRWCTDRWKRKPLEDYRKGKAYYTVIGIDAGEAYRAARWRNDENALFPLIDFGMDRKACINEIKRIGWKVPIKSGCWFCPYEKMDSFKDLKLNDKVLFDELCLMEKQTLTRLKDSKMKGWYDEKRPLNEAVEYRYPIACDGQMCLYCYG